MSSLVRKALCIVINFLILWSICCSSLVNFKNGPEYSPREIIQVFFSLMKFLQLSLVSRSFLVGLRYFFLIRFLSPPLQWWCPLQNRKKDICWYIFHYLFYFIVPTRFDFKVLAEYKKYFIKIISSVRNNYNKWILDSVRNSHLQRVSCIWH